jgi:hypothetical protein
MKLIQLHTGPTGWQLIASGEPMDSVRIFVSSPTLAAMRIMFLSPRWGYLI